jgi:hypothetical protein
MFSHSLVDTLRLAFGQVVYHHKSHTRAAVSLTRWSRYLRASETLLLLATLITSVSSAFGKGQPFAIAAAVLAGLTFLVFLIHVAFDFDSLARAHHSSSIRLWHVREQYRALLSDLQDGAVEEEFARARRNALTQEVTAIHEAAPPLTRRVFKTVDTTGEGAEEAALADGEIDRFLPKSLQAQAAAPATPGAPAN